MNTTSADSRSGAHGAAQPGGVIRIRYQSNTAFDDLPGYAAALRAHAKAILGKEVEVEFNGLPAAIFGGSLPGEVLGYPYLKHMVQDAALEACFQAERTGIDAFIIGSFSEPLLKASRSAIDIPVLSLPESALLIGCSLAERCALITLSPAQSKRVTEIVERHGMQSRTIGCCDLGGQFSEAALEAALRSPAKVLAAFEEAGRRAIAEGADLLIPAEGILNEVVYSNRLQRVGNAAVMDCVGVVLMHAEMMVKARRVLGLGVGRQWSYPKASPELVNTLRRGTGRTTV